jgi:hypothetical protein
MTTMPSGMSALWLPLIRSTGFAYRGGGKTDQFDTLALFSGDTAFAGNRRETVNAALFLLIFQSERGHASFLAISVSVRLPSAVAHRENVDGARQRCAAPAAGAGRAQFAARFARAGKPSEKVNGGQSVGGGARVGSAADPVAGAARPPSVAGEANFVKRKIGDGPGSASAAPREGIKNPKSESESRQASQSPCALRARGKSQRNG